MHKQFYKDKIITLHTREDHMMGEIADKSITAILTDPPYGVNFRSNFRYASDKFARITGDKDLSWVPQFLQESHRVLKDPGAMICFTRWDVLTKWETYVETAGFMYKQLLIWDKGTQGSLGDLDGSFSPAHELMMFCTKGRFKMHSKRRVDVFKYNKLPPGSYIHPTQKPDGLLEDVVNCLVEGKKDVIVVDPYSGSGSTLRACRNLGINCIGYELEPDDKQQYATVQVKSFQQSAMGLRI